MSIFKENACLAAYFSRAGDHYIGEKFVDLPAGNTETVAKWIGGYTGAREFRIEPVTPYPIDLRKTAYMAQRELYADARPKLAGHLDHMGEYAVVFLGFPIWWESLPVLVVSFLERYDFSNKTLIPFCTHEGSGFGQSEHIIRIHCPGAKLLPGLAVHASEVQTAQDRVLRWLKETEALL